MIKNSNFYIVLSILVITLTIICISVIDNVNYVTCTTCDGEGKAYIICNNCNGEKYVECYRFHGSGREICSDCDGRGKVKK